MFLRYVPRLSDFDIKIFQNKNVKPVIAQKEEDPNQVKKPEFRPNPSSVEFKLVLIKEGKGRYRRKINMNGIFKANI